MAGFALDEGDLKRQLRNLGFPRAIAFAASCCERMVPNYAAFQRQENWGDAKCLERGLDFIWSWLSGAQASRSEIRSLMHSIEVITPDTEDFGSILGSSALDACSALTCTLNCLVSPKLKDIVAVARSALDTVDMYIQERDKLDPNSRNLRDRVRVDPLMQRELKRMQEVLTDLSAIDQLTPRFLVKLRRSSGNAGKSSIDL